MKKILARADSGLGGGGSLPTSALSVRHRGAQDQAAGGAVAASGLEPSPHSDADAQCEFRYQPQGWAQACRFLALRYEKEPAAGAAEQYQLFANLHLVFVTNLAEPIAAVVWFYNQRAGAENLIKEAHNDAGLAAHPSRRFDMNRSWPCWPTISTAGWRGHA